MKIYRPLASLSLLAALIVSALAENTNLVLNGSGPRTKPIIGTLYDLSLHVPEALKGSESKTLIESDQPMEFRLEIKSRLITRERFVETTTGGFDKAAKSGYPSPDSQKFLGQFANTEFKKGDTVIMQYGVDGLTTRYRKADNTESTLSTIPGIALKKSLFAIWLGNTPAQDSLKKALLSPK